MDVAACPDCLAKLTFEQAQLRCTGCDRVFAAAGSGFDLLPNGVASFPTCDQSGIPPWRQKFIARVYTPFNRSSRIRRAVRRVLDVLDDDSWGLNIGSSETLLHPRLLNLDICPNPKLHVLGTAERLPFADGSLACAISQEVFEHLPDPFQAAREVARVLRPGGLFYLQAPFIIGFHNGPHDYWRMTGKGLCELVQSVGLEAIDVQPAIGAGTSMYRISVEFAATLAAALWQRLYLPAKAAAALCFVPVRWLDFITTNESKPNRIPAGYFVIAKKSGP